MDHAYGPASDREAMVQLIHESIVLHCNFFDTAEVYGTANEELLGRALVPYKGSVIIATKFGIATKSEDVGDRSKPMMMDSSQDAIRKSVEGSLRRLQADCIDLYYQHRVDPKVLNQKPWIVPIPGTAKLTRLRENLGAADFRLTDSERTRFDEALENIAVDETHFSPDKPSSRQQSVSAKQPNTASHQTAARSE